ncbi:alpha-glucosidase [Bifidobacterium bombi]|uniref:Oligo-1,6-glucosidase n=1 Tax=Bifidobacterium bombi DSM 19703 TaxID=1341695 RepID=A0A080N420_9BIFI|nr:alpha-glucosidase [Bifidobacterium bombi]KFF30980.1 oligo-1,6-glucosidase [Bifidobacterium bombi DSM 19703]
MTLDHLRHIPDDVHTNGATPNPWWANAVVYQIYPRSFKDANGDGFGDLKGITSKLDYLVDLGVDIIWLSPIYVSPQDDNGYDISDYRDIDPMFGTLGDMDELIEQAHIRGIKVVMDLVVNHTSDEHRWFQESRDKDSKYADWYWWRPAREGFVAGTPGAEPNRWGGTFGGSAWQYDAGRGEYYLHTFSKKQPDLNWENPDVRRAVYDLMNWWLDRGVDGFRMDVITLISKRVDKNGRLPGEAQGLIEDTPVGEEGYSNPWPLCQDGPRLDEYLREMRREVFEGRKGTFTVGEGQGISPIRNREITDPDNRELDMIFLFDHMGADQAGTKWNIQPLRLTKLKRAMASQQSAVKDRGWASLYFNNHDQPRSVSRWGDTSSPRLRIKSAKALALLMHMHRGTPYIYQGEELGMTNAGFTRLDQYRDLESINSYHQRVDEARVQSAQSMMDSLSKVSRDNSRTPMQWDASEYAGFTSPESQRSPWLEVNANKGEINVELEMCDPESVYSFYKRLISLRHEDEVVSAGGFEMMDPLDERVYAFVRELDGRRLLTAVNMSSTNAVLPEQTCGLLGERGLVGRNVLIANVATESISNQVEQGILEPWTAFVCEL